MAEDDQAYYQRRAETEMQLAQQATMPSVVQTHYAFAEAYRGKLTDVVPTPTLGCDESSVAFLAN